MTHRLIAASGLTEKAPAAFVVEMEGRRILFDLGASVGGDVGPDPAKIGTVDALVLSHAHHDHCGALDLLPAIGDPPVHASRHVLDGLKIEGMELPVGGEAEICGLPALTGRSGHALGGLWVRLGGPDGLLYMGDHLDESDVLAFDPPPHAGTLVLDASYGPAREQRAQQTARLIDLASASSVHFPVPADGRGMELAIVFSLAGLPVAIDGKVRAMLARLGGRDGAYARPGIADHARRLAEELDEARPDFPGAILTADATGKAGESARLIEARSNSTATLIFTGHLEKGTPGADLVARGEASRIRWNVHPTIDANLRLKELVAPQRVVAAFGPSGDADFWRSRLEDAVPG